MIKKNENIIFCSVVMPVHNGERFLREAIESVLNQTYTNFEFLIIENCSTDSSLKIINSYNDSRIRLIVEPECGIVQGYNRGFKEAKGKYIVVHDQDDISSTIRIETLLSYVLKHDLDICGSSFSIINNKNEKIKEILPPIDKIKIMEQLFYDFFALFNPTLIINHKILSELNYFDTNFPIGSDYDFLLRSLEKYKIGNISSNLLSYRVHDDSSSKINKEIGKDIDFEISLIHFYKNIHLFNDSEYIKGRIYYYFGRYFKACHSFLNSINREGFRKVKIKYLLFSSVFAFPIYYLRKKNIFLNYYFNRIISFLKGEE